MTGGERLELVTRFEDLRAGDRIADLNCGACGSILCPATLADLCKGRERGVVVDAWSVKETCTAPAPGGQFRAVTARMVAARRIFRILPPQTTFAAGATHEQPLERA